MKKTLLAALCASLVLAACSKTDTDTDAGPAVAPAETTDAAPAEQAASGPAQTPEEKSGNFPKPAPLVEMGQADTEQWVTSAGRTPDGKIIVTEENFVVAETDKYFAEHSEKIPINRIRHSREYSTVDNQVVIRENQDALYSHAVVDVSEGATITNPEWANYSIIQIMDENQYSFAHLYPGESITLTPDDLSFGNYVWLNIRTEVRPNSEEGWADAHRHQDAYIIDAKSAVPYPTKGFDRASLDAVRSELLTQAAKVNSWEAFGTKDVVDPEQFIIAAAGGWAGLPREHAVYWPKFVPGPEALEGACSQLTLKEPPLDFDKGGFFSATAYGPDAFIATENYALSSRNAEANPDGSVTFRFNCPGMANNIDTKKGAWNVTIRFYRPTDFPSMLAYIEAFEADGTAIEVVKE